MRMLATSLLAALLMVARLALAPDFARAAPQDPPPQFAPTLAAGSIADIQRQLAAHGYRAGAPTGRVDAATRRAIMSYQKDAGLTPDGIASPALQNHLRFAQPAIRARAPRRDPLIAQAQEELKRLGYYQQGVDGVAGAATRDALARFQGATGRPLEPRITAATLDALRQTPAR
jgi:peptidoglycan hydrolase-like protein with peptidoglycan-binding domain